MFFDSYLTKNKRFLSLGELEGRYGLLPILQNKGTIDIEMSVWDFPSDIALVSVFSKAYSVTVCKIL